MRPCSQGDCHPGDRRWGISSFVARGSHRVNRGSQRSSGRPRLRQTQDDLKPGRDARARAGKSYLFLAGAMCSTGIVVQEHNLWGNGSLFINGVSSND
jgi:hypothetical protein